MIFGLASKELLNNRSFSKPLRNTLGKLLRGTPHVDILEATWSQLGFQYPNSNVLTNNSGMLYPYIDFKVKILSVYMCNYVYIRA